MIIIIENGIDKLSLNPGPCITFCPWLKRGWFNACIKIFVWLHFVLLHINHCSFFDAKSIFIHINSSIPNNSVQHKYRLFCLHRVNSQNCSISNNSV